MIFRRLRGVTVTAVVWFVGWIPLGLGVGIWLHSLAPAVYIGNTLLPSNLLPFVSIVALVCSTWGAVSGVLFAILFMRAERARAIQDVSRSRTAIWGGVAGAFLPVVLNLLNLGDWSWDWGTWLTLGLGAAMGVGCALTTITLAQRGRADVAA